jgi:hypothetical protein
MEGKMEVVCAINDKTYIWPNGIACLLDKNLEFPVLIKKENSSLVVKIKDLKKPP